MESGTSVLTANLCEGAAERAGAVATGAAPSGGAGGRGRGDAAPPHHHPGTVHPAVTVLPIIRYFFYVTDGNIMYLTDASRFLISCVIQHYAPVVGWGRGGGTDA
jgi:hypothetical protein